MRQRLQGAKLAKNTSTSSSSSCSCLTCEGCWVTGGVSSHAAAWNSRRLSSGNARQTLETSIAQASASSLPVAVCMKVTVPECPSQRCLELFSLGEAHRLRRRCALSAVVALAAVSSANAASQKACCSAAGFCASAARSQQRSSNKLSI